MESQKLLHILRQVLLAVQGKEAMLTPLPQSVAFR